jgi:[ribosomal protein S5]-alanine N-acetyltransferase
MSPRAELQTARLTLRPVAPADEGVVVACLNDLSVSGWLSVVPYPYAAVDFHHFRSEMAKPGETFAVLDSDGLAGIVGAGRELGYWFAPRCHGRGYATEAARAALAEQLAHDPSDVVSGYFEGNARSANVLRKLGFVEVGRRANHCRALGIDRPHVDMRLTRAAFVAALPIEARSARLTFRSLQATDLEALHEVVSHWDVVRQLASYPWPPERGFTRTRARPFLGRGFVWGAFLNSRLIGTVAVTGEELGYMFAPGVWGQGYATEACRMAISRAFADGWDHLEAGIWADNIASLGLLRKLGFRVTGNDLALNKARGVEVAGHTLRLDRADWPDA